MSVEVKDQAKRSPNPCPSPRSLPESIASRLPADLPVRPESHPTLVVSARRDNGSQVELNEEMQLAAPVYVTHLEIDKPMYQLGETVYFRSLTLDRFSLKPAEQDLQPAILPGPARTGQSRASDRAGTNRAG